MGKILTKDDLLSGELLKRELCELPDGNQVYVQEFSAEQLIEYNDFVEGMQINGPEVTGKAAVELMCMAVSFSACDENGSLLFTKEEAFGLAKNSMSMLEAIATKALSISGMKKEVADNLKKVRTDSLPTG